jgi:DNA-binding NarL/FixJ family response regulator
VKDDRIGQFSVMLVSDHVVFAEGLGMVLRMQDRIDVVGLAGCADDALTLASILRPEVLIVDASLPASEVDLLLRTAGQSGLDALVLLLTDEADAAAVPPAGVEAVLSKRVSGRQLAGAVRALVEGQHHLLSWIAAATREPARRAQRPRDNLDLRIGGLTRRERQVLTMVACGYSNRRIASECVVSLNTVRAHVQNVLVKLGVHSRLEAAAFAVARGIATG